jgi:3-oxoacyl-[acyl-carrier protein] reductase
MMLASRGWSIALCARHGDEAAAAAEEIQESASVPVIGMAADVARPKSVAEFASRAEHELGPVSAVIANAAVLGPVGPVHEVDLAQWAQALHIDVAGVANTIAAFVGPMIDRRSGSIVTLAGGGVGGPGVAPFMSAYTASKAAVAMLTETVAKELEPHRVRLNAIAPGAFATRFMDSLIEAGPARAGSALYEQVTEQRTQPLDFARFDALLAFLVDAGAPFITGRVLTARWESPDRLAAEPIGATSSRFRLRRIDEDLYLETVIEGNQT